MTDTATPRPPTAATARVAGAVRAELARANVSGRALAAHLNLSHTAMSRRLGGHVPLRVDELHAIAEHLGIPVSRLYEVPVPRTADAG